MRKMLLAVIVAVAIATAGWFGFRLWQLVADRNGACCARSGRTVHFVGHPLGGFLIRAYLGAHRPEQMGRVVQLGAPNGGSKIADAGMADFVMVDASHWQLRNRRDVAALTVRFLQSGVF